MKFFAVVLFQILLVNYGFAQQLNFHTGSWEEANDQASKEGKFIMLDAYTDWCGWCKVMDKELFTDSTVVPFIEKHFVSVKMNFEDSLGIIMAMKFRVWVYPTLLFFNSQGQLVNKIMGYMPDHSKFLVELKKTLDITEEQLFAFDSQKLDIDYPELYSDAFYSKEKGSRYPDDSTITSYLDSQDDLYSEVNFSIIYKFKSDKYNQYFVDNYEKYKALYGQYAEDKLIDIIYYRVKTAIDSNDIKILDDAMPLFNRLNEPEIYIHGYRMYFFEETKDWVEYTNEIAILIERDGMDAHSTINSSCWTLYENCEDKKILKQASLWMAELTRAYPNWMYTDTYAALLFKSGDLKKAEEIAKFSIKLGKEEGEKDLSSTEKLLEKIREKMAAEK